MPYRVKCPFCGRVQSIDPSEAGHRVMCPACGARYEAPAIAGIIPPAPKPVTPPPPPADPILSAKNRPHAPSSAQPADASDPSPHHSNRWIYTAAIASVLIAVIGGALLIQRINSTPHQASTSVPPHPAATRPAATSVVVTTRPSTALAAATGPTTTPLARAEIPTTAPATEPEPIPTMVATERPPASEPLPAPTTSAPPALSPAAVAVVPPPPPPPATLPTTEPTVAHPIPRLHPVHPQVDLAADTLDDQIGQAIQQGTSYLLRQFKNGKLQDVADIDNNTIPGLHALATYALLQAGAATEDDRLGPNTPVVDEILKMLKAMPMDRGPATYSRALRAAALSVYNRGGDQRALRADVQWLLHASNNGAYTYEIPGGSSHRGSTWDNSNSQYGALGVWAATEAGEEVPLSYWGEVERHWLSCQLANGQWSYEAGDNEGSLSMTVAGITTLFVTQDQLGAGATAGGALGRPPFSPALAKALKWLETGGNAVELPWRWHTYNLFGLERAALASGFKYFGKHDWYRELARDALLNQRPDGSWYTIDGRLNPTVDTAYTLLFLSRGRHPIFMNKLRFDGFWANRPRDVSNLARFAVHSLERQLNWQVVSLDSDWTDWTDSPILFIASHEVPKFSPDDYDKLRAYAQNGGLIFTHADGESAAFNRFAETLAARLFPNYPLTDLPPTHEIYSTLFKVNPKPRLQGVSNGSRLLLVHSPTELSRWWQTRDAKLHAPQFQLGLNTFIYAAGKRNFRNKLETAYVPEPTVTPIASATIARLRYNGNWDPEPAAWTRLSRLFLADTSIKPEPTPIDPQDLTPDTARLAHLTGTAEVHLDDNQVKAIHDFVASGGVLLIDACGGSSSFAQSIRADLLPRAFPKSDLKPLSPDHPILAGTGQGLTRVAPHLRPYAAETLGTLNLPLQILHEGEGYVIFTSFDLTTALLGTSTYTVLGCDPETALPLCRNILLWTLAGTPG